MSFRGVTWKERVLPRFSGEIQGAVERLEVVNKKNGYCTQLRIRLMPDHAQRVCVVGLGTYGSTLAASIRLKETWKPSSGK